MKSSLFPSPAAPAQMRLALVRSPVALLSAPERSQAVAILARLLLEAARRPVPREVSDDTA
jgi:hypothetical protein